MDLGRVGDARRSVSQKQICGKYLANWKEVFCAFIYLENQYDTIDRHGMWQMLRVYGVGGNC